MPSETRVAEAHAQQEIPHIGIDFRLAQGNLGRCFPRRTFHTGLLLLRFRLQMMPYDQLLSQRSPHHDSEDQPQVAEAAPTSMAAG
jgi:hypothetical protein